MLNSVDPNKKVPFRAVKDVIPQNVNAKLPQGIQNYDAKEQVQDSMVGSVSSGIMDTQGLKPWQIALSIVGAVGVVLGLSAYARHLVKSNKIFKVGEKLDDLYVRFKKTKVGEKLSGIKKFFNKNIGERFKKSSFGELYKKDASGYRPNMISGESPLVQIYTNGSKFEGCDEITDTIEQLLGHNKKPGRFKFINQIKEKISVFGEKIGLTKKGAIRFDGEEGLRKLITDSGHGKEADELVDLAKRYSENVSNKQLKYELKDRFMPIFKDFFGINEKSKTNAGKKLSEIMKGAKNKDFRQKVKIMGLTHDVDVLTTVKNMMIIDGEGAKTPLGRLFQKFAIKTFEAPTNGVISRSKTGILMGMMLYFGVLNKIQKAKKGEKISTAGEEITTDIGGYMMLPVNGAITYGLASLKNLGVKDFAKYDIKRMALNEKFKEAVSGIDKQAIIKEFKQLKKETYATGSWWQKILRTPGRILSLGLKKGPGQGKVSGFLGGALRFVVMMLVLSPILIKPIRKMSAKVFGKTTEMKEEEAKKAEKKARKKQLKELRKAQRNNPNPTIPMSKEELTQKLMENPALLQKLQSDPQLLDQVSKNPELLMQMLNEKPAAPSLSQTAQVNTTPKYMSPALKQRLNNSTNMAANNNVIQGSPFDKKMVNNAPVQPAQTLEKKASATPPANVAATRSYIPSAAPTNAPNANSTLTPEQRAAMQSALAKADAAERAASQVLS